MIMNKVIILMNITLIFTIVIFAIKKKIKSTFCDIFISKKIKYKKDFEKKMILAKKCIIKQKENHDNK